MKSTRIGLRMARLFALALFLAGVIWVSAGNEPAAGQGGIEVIPADQLKLRVGPGRNFAEIAVIPAGTSLTAYARNEAGDWVKVDFSGASGWVSAPYLRYRGSLLTLPVGDLPSPGGNPGEAASPEQPAGPPQNGQIDSMVLYAQTDRADYYRIVYWSDGLRIAGYYAEPRFSGQFAAVIYNRGGNRGTGALQGFELAPFAETGFVVVASQYRGGPGSEGADEFGGGDVNDVLALIPLLKSRPLVDPNRIAMFGSSRGGLMTYIALKKLAEQGRTDIKVASTTSGVADLFMWAKERPDLNSGFYLETIGGNANTSPGALKARSATYWPGLIRVPLLIQHGDADTVVSVEQSKTLAAGMKRAGRNVKLMVQAFGDHGLFNYDEGFPETFKWFRQYIGRGEDWDFALYKEAIYAAYAKLRTNW